MSLWTIKESTRARHLRILVYPSTREERARVVITKPKRVSVKAADDFARKNIEWIEQQLAKQAKKKPGEQLLPLPKYRRGSLARKEAVEQARKLVHARLAHFNEHYKQNIGSISIRAQKTRWGSCSSKGNMAFNYRLLFLPQELSDYIVVHELCHIQQMNHSLKFWALVAETVPEHKAYRKQLHRYEM